MWIEGLLLYIIIQGVVADIPAVRSIIKSMIIATLFIALTSYVLSWFGLRYDSLLATLTGGPVGPNVSGDQLVSSGSKAHFPRRFFSRLGWPPPVSSRSSGSPDRRSRFAQPHGQRGSRYVERRSS